MKNFTQISKVCMAFLFIFMIHFDYCSATGVQMSVQLVTVSNNGSVLEMAMLIENNSSSRVLNTGTWYLEYDPTSVTFSSGSWGYKFDPNATTSGGGGAAPANYTTSGTVFNDNGASTGKTNTSYNLIVFKLEGTSPGGSTGAIVSNSSYDTLAIFSFAIASGHTGGTANFDWGNFGEYGSAALGHSFGTDVVYAGNSPYQMGNGWAATSSVTPLPVTLVSFSATTENGVTQLNWTTASEINNAYFTIEGSADGVNFISLFNRDGSGNSEKRINYVAYDERPLPGTSYYRLKQTDFNGAAQTFNMVAVQNLVLTDFVISSVSPTNFTDNITLYYKMSENAIVKLAVTNMEGKIVAETQVPSLSGNNIYRFGNTTAWSPGLYIVNLGYNGKVTNIKIIKD